MIPLEWMPPLMFGGLVIFMLIGFPVAFSLMAAGLFFSLIAMSEGFFGIAFLQAIPQRIFGSVLANDLLLAIPFFTFMGAILERCGLAEEMLDSMGQLFGRVRGGLGYSVIIVGFILGAITGTVAAQVIAMAMISLPVMMRYGYNMRYSTGVLAASGTITQLVPPSLVLIVMADQLGRSVGDMYKGAFIPGFVLTGLYICYVVTLSFFRPKWVPALPPEARTFREPDGSSGGKSLIVLAIIAFASGIAFAKTRPADAHLDEVIIVSIVVGIGVPFVIAMINRVMKLGLLSAMAEKVTFVLIPPLGLIFLVLGTIFLGVATPTEGGAMGATGALGMALLRKRLNMQLLKQAMESTTKLTTFVLFILIGARVFSLTFYAVDGHLWVEHLLVSLPGGQMGFLLVVNLLIFVLAFFLDYFELSFIIVPLLAPVADKMGIDLIWFGVLLGINMQTSFLHPPFGFSLFFLRSVAPPTVKTSEIYWGAIPFVLIQILMVGLIIVFPQMVTFGLDKTVAVDLDTIKIEVPDYDYSTPPPLELPSEQPK